MQTIFELAKQFPKTDKCSLDGKVGHCYGQEVYEDLFKDLRDKEIDLLEIGVQSGDSILLWDAVFPNAGSITGIDTDSSNFYDTVNKGKGNIVLIEGDAYTSRVSNLLGQFDIIIDDGPHTLDSQVYAIQEYLPKLKKGGILVIEDVLAGFAKCSNYWTLCKMLTNAPTTWSNVKWYNLYDLRNKIGREDDVLLVMQKCEIYD